VIRNAISEDAKLKEFNTMENMKIDREEELKNQFNECLYRNRTRGEVRLKVIG